MKIPRFLRILGTMGIVASATVAPPPAITESLEPIKRKENLNESDIIGSEDWKLQGRWENIRLVDEHVYKYTKLNELVNQDVDTGHFWKKINYRRETENGIPYHVLEGIRDDDRNFLVKSIVRPVGLDLTPGREKTHDPWFNAVLCDFIDKLRL